MTPENQMKDQKAAQKQKIIIGVIVVVVLIVLWQFLNLGSGASAPAAITPVASAPAPAKAPTANAVSSSPGGNMSAPGGGMAAPVVSNVDASPQALRQERAATNAEISKLQQQSQTEYISSLNKLQILKLQREIDETKMAIATAELNRMTAEKNIADLITSKSDNLPEISGPPSGLQLPATPAGAPPALPGVGGPPAAAAAAAAAAGAEVPYTVLSVSYEGRKWAAVLSATGKKYSVSIGDTLPPDGSTIVAIDKQGVTLKNKTKTRSIAISSTM
jgi:hypothetical protein